MPEREETASAPLASTAVERPVPISPIRNPVRVQVRGPARSSAVRRLPARRRRAGKTVLRRNYKQQALLGAPATELLRNPQSAIDNPQSAIAGMARAGPSILLWYIWPPLPSEKVVGFADFFRQERN